MKRIFTAFLAILLVLSAVSCSAGLESAITAETKETKEDTSVNPYLPKKTQEKKPVSEPLEGTFEKEGFSAGFGRYIITPPKGAPMGGYSNDSVRLSDEVLDELYVSCVALWDGENTALFFSVDVLSVPVSVWEKVCTDIETEFGIPKEFVFITATHSHSGPTISLTGDGGSIFMPRAVKAARDAIASLDSATISFGETETKDMSFVRRYLKEDGTPIYRDDLPSDAKKPAYRHEADPDTQMLLLRLNRKNQKDIVMVNWSCHVTTVGGSTNTDISADWVGAMREEVEKTEDVYFAFYQSAAGDTTPGTRLADEYSNAEDYVKHGKDLAKYVSDALPTLEEVPAGKIRAVGSILPIYYNTDTEGYSEEAIAAAGQIAELLTTNSPTAELVNTYGFASARHARSIYNRSKREEGSFKEMNLGAIAIGEIAFTYAPYEMLSATGMQIKAASPFARTFVCGYTNGSFGYIPYKEAFPNRQYEVDTCQFAVGTAEAIAAELNRLLLELK